MSHKIPRMAPGLSKILPLTTLLALACGADIRAQDIGGGDVRPATEYVKWTAQASPARVTPGGAFLLRVGAELEAGWKMYAPDSPRPSYGARLQFDELPVGIETIGELEQSTPIEAFDPFFEATVRYYEREAAFSLPLRVAPDASVGERSIGGSVIFMICNDLLCLPPTEVAVGTSLEIAMDGDTAMAPNGGDRPASAASPPEGGREGSVGTDAPGVASSPGDMNPRGGIDAPGRANDQRAAIGGSRDLEDARAGGLLGFILLAVGAGLAALLTPCVFPMIPLTVSYFTRHTENRRESARMAGIYGATIVITFTALGVLTAIFVGAAGGQTIAANPWINLTIGLVFVVFALSLLGLFELRLPNGLLNYFNRRSNEQGGYLGVGFMGLTLTLVSFSCTAPFVGGLLAATASDQWAYPVLGMLLFSTTFSLPFVVFALFPNAMSALPRSGAWMNTVKVVLGFVELAAALKFFSNADLIWGWGVISRPLAIALAVVIFFLTGAYLIGKIRLSHDPPPQHTGVVQLLFAIGFFGLSLYMLPGLFGAPLNALDAYLPPRQAGDVSLLSAYTGAGPSDESDLDWTEDIDEAYRAGRRQDKPVFVDFTGYTCTNCRQMEANVFPKPAIAATLRQEFVLLRLYTDDQESGPDLQRLQLRMTGTVALPTYAVVNPHNELLLTRQTGMATVVEFATFLQRGLDEYRSIAEPPEEGSGLAGLTSSGH